MYVATPEFRDGRLRERYLRMVESHLSPAQRLASGLRHLSNEERAWSATQAAYRFLNNDRIRLAQLAKPLIEMARHAVPEACQRYALVVHDWSLIRFRRHHSKQDRLALRDTQWKEGYKLNTCLLVGDQAGESIAPLVTSLHTAAGVHSSMTNSIDPAMSALDALDPAMTFVERQQLGKPVVHIIDAEADSVAHYRQWSERPERHYLVRADDRIVTWQGEEARCSAVATQLHAQGRFERTRSVEHQGRQAEQWVAEAEVWLTRPGQQNRADGSKVRVPGPPLPLRLIIAETRAANGQTLSTWYLLTNVPADVDASTVALWYYWRWRVESYFKLLKTAGLCLEQWQQETPAALARRLLVASMACVVVWRLERDNKPEAAATRKLLVQLSGRLMKRNKPSTAPALLAGLWVLLQLQSVLQDYDLDTLRSLAAYALPRAGPS